MFPVATVSYVVLSLLLSSQNAVAREQWLERDGRAVFLHPRRFGQERPPVIDKLSAACPGQVCGTLAGAAITPLLAAQPECSQQDMADQIIDASKQFDAATQANMIAIAKEYRQAEKNTPPDFTTNPPSLRNSVFCQKAPKNPELNGLVQAQDPANDPDLFFDPATKATVKKGSQANTFPFGGATAPAPASSASASASADTSTIVAPTATGVLAANPASTTDCETITVTVTVTGTNPAATGPATVIDAGDATGSSITPSPSGTTSAGNIGDFGKCSIPEIVFGVGFNDRKETSFEPKDKVSYDHDSAQNIDIITQFICDTLVNSCEADQVAQQTCQRGRAAASGATKGTGAQADAFNGIFGIPTTFVDTPSVDNQGNIIPGTGKVGASPSGTSSSSAPSATSTSAFGNFGTCTVPQIEFGAGFDGRKETTFQPVDRNSYNHSPAQNIDIISEFICDSLTNTCGADDTAKTTCNNARNAANAAPARTGAQADAFNKAMGINTNFASVPALDDQGQPVGGSSQTSQSVPSPTTSLPTSTRPPASKETPPPASDDGNLQKFTGALRGIAAPAVTVNADGKFQVAGNAFFNTKGEALQRSCDVQNNNCSDAANASGNKDGFTVPACNEQQRSCFDQAQRS